MSPTSWWSIGALAVTSASSIITLLKEKREKRGHRWHRALLALTGIGLIVGIVLVWHADKDTVQSENTHHNERDADKQQIAGLTQSIQTQISNNENQYTRNQEQIRGLQGQLSELRTQVATAELRKKIDALQTQLGRALAPVPTAKLEASFWSPIGQDDVLTDIYAPVEGNVVKFALNLVNHSGVSAKAGGFWLRLCPDCKFHGAVDCFEHVAGAPESERVCNFSGLPADSRSQKLSIEIELPSPNIGRLVIGTRYRCENCDIQKNWHQLTVNLGRLPFPRLSPPAAPKKKSARP